jgi:hypothetical protein
VSAANQLVSVCRTTAPGRFRYVVGDLSPVAVVDSAEGWDGVRGVCWGRATLHGVLGALMRLKGPARLYFATWVNEGKYLHNIIPWFEVNAGRGVVLAARSGLSRVQPAFVRRVLALFGPGSLRSAETHSEIGVAVGDGWSALYRTSGHFGETNKLEWFDLDLRPEVSAAHVAWFEGLPVVPPLVRESPPEQLSLRGLVGKVG